MKLLKEDFFFRQCTIFAILISFAGLFFAPDAQADYLSEFTGKVVYIKKKNRLILTAQNATIKQVLRKLGRKGGITFHYSELPHHPINFTCVERNLPSLIKCALQNQADMALRYRYDKKKQRTKIAEAWITPFQLATSSTQVQPGCPPQEVGVIDHGERLPASMQQEDQGSATKMEQLLEQAQAGDAANKVEALSQLLAQGRQDDPRVRDVLERSLTDKNPEVRAQAVSGLSHIIKSDATAAVQQGLQDSNDDVRLMAVEGISYDQAILEQALGDDNEAVRSLAELKLKLLNRQQAQSGNSPDK